MSFTVIQPDGKKSLLTKFYDFKKEIYLCGVREEYCLSNGPNPRNLSRYIEGITSGRH